jgi:hypothetical protein
MTGRRCSGSSSGVDAVGIPPDRLVATLVHLRPGLPREALAGHDRLIG